MAKSSAKLSAQLQTVKLELRGEVKEYPVVMEDRVVEVLRETDGRIFSTIRKEPKDRNECGIVIDREKRWREGDEYVVFRARALAILLGLRYVEDLRWPCSSLAGQKDCRCPKCVGTDGVRQARHA